MPFPQRLQKPKREEQFSRFLDIFKKIEINIPFTKVINQMPIYAKFLKEILNKKRKIAEEGIVNLTATCSAIIQQKLPAKMKDPGNFTIPCSIGKNESKKALCDSSAIINLMPLSVVQRLSLGELTPTTITLQMADRSMAQPEGILEDVLVKVRKFIFPVDFVIMKMEEDTQVPLLLGRPFLATGAALIDVQKGELTLRVGNEAVHFNLNRSLEHPDVDAESCMVVENNSLLNVEFNSDCILQHSINEIEMNFQYLESLDCEILPSNLFNKVFACVKFRPYILRSHVIIHTDHATIKYLMAKKEAKPRLIRWVLLLQEFDLEIKDKKGCDNVIADHLSRVEKPAV